MVCARWRESFETFLADMGPRPSLLHTIERKDNDRHYEPDNCHWATQKEQQRHRRNNRLLTIDGETMPVTAWAERVGVKAATLHARLQTGLDHRSAVFYDPAKSDRRRRAARASSGGT